MEKSFSIKIKVAPGERGLKELRAWPNTSFTPDFIVAASGFVSLQIGGQYVYADKAQMVKVINERLSDKQEWPDYVVGFARNLAEAALKMQQPGFKSAQAAFIDEPAALTFKAVAPDRIEVAFKLANHAYASKSLPLTTVLPQIRATLEDLLQQLLVINPALASQPDVSYLAMVIEKL